MRIEQMILSIDPDDSGTVEGHIGGLFQPVQAEVTRRTSGALEVALTGPKIKKGGGQHATARGQWWDVDDEATSNWPPVALTVREIVGRASQAAEGGAEMDPWDLPDEDEDTEGGASNGG